LSVLSQAKDLINKSKTTMNSIAYISAFKKWKEPTPLDASLAEDVLPECLNKTSMRQTSAGKPAAWRRKEGMC
jgi:hypothetical protein